MSEPNTSELKRGRNGLPYVELRHPSGASLEVYLHGAHAVSWCDAGGRQLLFISKKSLFKPGTPIRGGIPMVFPQFGDGPLLKHGFARIREWMFLGAESVKSGHVEARLELKENQQTLQLWPHEFRLELVFRLGAEDLEILFSVQNTGRSEFEFQNGLHTYFSVADIGQVSLAGLIGAGFVDFLGDRTVCAETRVKIKFERETDRVYPLAPDTIILEDGGNRRKMRIEKQGMSDVVIWNPWVEKSKRMEDFGDEEYKDMVCVETGNLHKPVRLVPCATHDSSTRIVHNQMETG